MVARAAILVLLLAALGVSAGSTKNARIEHKKKGHHAAAKKHTESKPHAKSALSPCTAPGTKGLKGLKNKANCFTTVRTDAIDDPVNGLQVGTINNWADDSIPKAMRGIFYLEGNPYAAETFSMGTATWNETTQSHDMALFSPRTWASDPGAGQLKHNLDEGVVFQTSCKTNWMGRQECFSAEYHTKTNERLHVGDYTSNEIEDNYWIRASNVRDFPLLGQISLVPGKNIALLRYGYKMYRIVDENGQRTSRWESNYIPNIGKQWGVDGQMMVHLGEEQEVPQRR